MIRNYIKIAWRNLWKNKVFSLINIIGLAVGMAACIVIMLFVLFENSFDSFHKKNIYRLNEVQKFPGMLASQKVALSMYPMGPTLKTEFPEIKNFTRVSTTGKHQMKYGEKKITLSDAYFVDSTFLNIFDFPLLEGDRNTALQRPHSAVLTASTARKFFGSEDPVGKTISSNNGDSVNLIVTGVLKDLPQNSQLQFDALYTFSTIAQPDMMKNWGGNWLYTYFELTNNADPKAMEKKFPAYLKKYMAESHNWQNYELFLLPLRSVHAKAADVGLDRVNYKQFNQSYTDIFSIIAIIVLIIACVNFMNLSTARSADRAKEVGIRKSVGAKRSQLSLQFIGETVLLSLISLVVALILVQLSLPFINHLSQRSLSFPFTHNQQLLLYIVLATVGVGVISGIYPAIYLSSFMPVKVLKGSMQSGKNKSTLRNILVVIQFASAVFLIIATIFALRQLHYMQHRDPGFNKDQVINVPSENGIGGQAYRTLKNQLLGNSNISGVTASQDILGSHLDQSGVHFKGDGPMRELSTTRLIVDPDYLRFFKIALLLGKDFSSDSAANGKEYIVNETLAKELLKDEPGKSYSFLLGKNFGFDSIGTIVGIARDFNFNTLHHKIETMFMYNQQEYGFSNLSVRINGNNAKQAIAHIDNVWKKTFPDNPLEYQFLDDHFKDVYQSDTQVSNIVGILAVLAILISCLGLFGLASYSAEKRIKEVGIRKVLGASAQSIVGLLSRHFLGLVLIANLIAWPAAWFVLNHWLQDYAYRVDMSWWVFVAAGLTAMLIALITVSFQAAKAAFSNPVESLRNE